MKGIFLTLFIGFLLFSGLYCMLRAKTLNDFFLGGRSVGPWLSAFAYGTTYFSAVIFIGYKCTRSMTVRLNTLTMPQFLAACYQSPSLKVVAALIIFVFMIPYSASVYMGFSYLFEQVLTIPYTYGALAMAILTAIYLATGDYRAVSLTGRSQPLF